MLNAEYKDLVIQYNKKPYHFYKMENPSFYSQGYHRVCGDQIDVYILEEDNRAKEISFQGDISALTKTSASLMIKSLEGKSLPLIQTAIQEFKGFIQKDGEFKAFQDVLEPLCVFQGVKENPARMASVLLPWLTLEKALHGESEFETE